jgi:hypothetical protein
LSVNFWLTATGSHRFAGQVEWLFAQLRCVTDTSTRANLVAFGVRFVWIIRFKKRGVSAHLMPVRIAN